MIKVFKLSEIESTNRLGREASSLVLDWYVGFLLPQMESSLQLEIMVIEVHPNHFVGLADTMYFERSSALVLATIHVR
jgi:hypothetical protein